MPDTEYIRNYCKSCDLAFSLTDDWIYIKDSEMRVCSISDNLLKLMGIPELDRILGKTNSEFNRFVIDHNIRALNDDRERQDQMIVSKGVTRNYLEIIPYNAELSAYIVTKTPIINPMTNNCVGVRSHYANMYSLNTIKTLFRVHNITGLLINQKRPGKTSFADYQLNSMQHMVLYLCIHKFSYSEISAIMCSIGHKITPNKVNEYIEQLKLIFRSSSKTQLIEKAIGLDFHVFLPKDILRPCSIDITPYKALIC